MYEIWIKQEDLMLEVSEISITKRLSLGPIINGHG